MLLPQLEASPMSHKATHYQNRLLQRLPESELANFRHCLEPVALNKGMQIARANRVVDYVYFFETGIASIVAQSPEGHQSEAGLFGREGFGPTSPALGVDHSSFDIFVQVPGDGFRLPLAAFHELVATSPAVVQKFRFFCHVMSVQTNFTGLSNAVHMVDERLARWLLMCHDRTDSDEIALTHEFLSLMLAVRRPSVTTALHILEGNRFIYANRGHVTIRDRSKLEEFAVDTYGAPEAEYEGLLGKMR